MTQSHNAPIKLIHGWGMNRQVWKESLALVSDAMKQRIECLDLPGYGDNAYLPEPYSIEMLTEWLNEQITEPTHVIGWSLGGLVAINFASKYSEKALSLGLVASSPKFQANDEWPGIQPNVLNNFAQQLKRDHKKTVEQFLKIQAMGSPQVKQDIKLLSQHLFELPAPQTAALKAGLELLETVDLRGPYSNLTMPVHGWFGQADSLVPAAAVDKMSALLPSANLIVKEKHSHAPFVSDPRGFADWLNEVTLIA